MMCCGIAHTSQNPSLSSYCKPRLFRVPGEKLILTFLGAFLYCCSERCSNAVRVFMRGLPDKQGSVVGQQRLHIFPNRPAGPTVPNKMSLGRRFCLDGTTCCAVQLTCKVALFACSGQAGQHLIPWHVLGCPLGSHCLHICASLLCG